MATIVLETNRVSKTTLTTKLKDQSITATVGSSPGRYHYATVNGKARTFERVGLDASGNEVYRDQNRR